MPRDTFIHVNDLKLGFPRECWLRRDCNTVQGNWTPQRGNAPPHPGPALLVDGRPARIARRMASRAAAADPGCSDPGHNARSSVGRDSLGPACSLVRSPARRASLPLTRFFSHDLRRL